MRNYLLYEAERCFDDPEKLKTMNRAFPDLLSCRDDDGSTLLHRAAFSGKKAVAELLLAEGADANAIRKDGKTPMHLAAEEGNGAIVEMLMGNKAAAYPKDNNGDTPLNLAVRRHHTHVVKLLEINLHEAAKKGSLERIRGLLEAFPDLLDAKDFSRETPLVKAVRTGRTEVVELLLALGADPNAGDALHAAAGSRRTEIVELLLAHGADVHATGYRGATPLHCALSKDIAETLIAHGANVNSKDDLGQTPLFGIRDVQVAEVAPHLWGCCQRSRQQPEYPAS